MVLGLATACATIAAVPGYDPLSGVTDVSTGGAHSCALLQDGAVACWGSNIDGQLGTNSQTDANTAALVDLPGAAMSVSAGTRSTCAMLSVGSLMCWGDNTFGQLGTGNTESTSVPAAVTGFGEAVTDVRVGLGHACALGMSGTVYCWGENSVGQLGQGDVTSRLTPTPVAGLPPVVQIDVSTQVSCALTEAGAVLCWGTNSSGSLDGEPGDSALSPHQVTTLASGVTQIAISAFGRRCALLNSGDVRCWGRATSQQSRDSSGGTTVAIPEAIQGFTGNVEQLTAGEYHVCALLTGGALQCLGGNYYGQLGDGGTRSTAMPVSVELGGASMVRVDAGDSHTCGVTSQGGLRCWGFNHQGQVGDKTSDRGQRTVPAGFAASSLSNVSAGADHSCGLDPAGVACWGLNQSGQLGDGTTVSRTSSALVQGIGPGARFVSAGTGASCAVTTIGAVKCWGTSDYGLGDGSNSASEVPVDVTGLDTGFIKVVLGGAHACALHELGDVYCWGGNYAGQLGYSGSSSTTPVKVDALGFSASDIAAGSDHSCAVSNAGALRCWGSNFVGQLGTGSTENSLVPVDVEPIGEAVTAISAGAMHTCALTASKNVYCWGFDGRVGDGTSTRRTSPTLISGLTDIAIVSAGESHTCAASEDGDLSCWGTGSYGEIGDGSVNASRLSPVPVGFEAVAEVSSGDAHTCARNFSGEISCWGINHHGTLGDGTWGLRTSPQVVLIARPGLTFADGFDAIQ